MQSAGLGMRNDDSVAVPRNPRSLFRWLKFSLGSLLLLITVFCVWLAVKSNAARRQCDGFELVTHLGGMYTYSMAPERAEGIGAQLMRAWLGDGNVVHVDSVMIWKATDEDVSKLVEAFPRLTGLTIGGEFSDAALVSIGELKNLKGLIVSSQHISNEGLRDLAAASDIERLRISGPISDAGMVNLRPLHQLTSLHCYADRRSSESASRLENRMPLECQLVPLRDVLDELSRASRLTLELDEQKLKSGRIDPETPITASHKMASLGYVLEQILEPIGLRARLSPTGVNITTRETFEATRPGLIELSKSLPRLREIQTDW